MFSTSHPGDRFCSSVFFNLADAVVVVVVKVAGSGRRSLEATDSHDGLRSNFETTTLHLR